MSKKEKTPWGRLLDTDYLDSYDFSENENKVVTISKIYTKEIIGGGGREDLCLIAEMKGEKKKLIVRKRTGQQIEQALKSRYIEDWIGQSVTLFINREKHFGSYHDCIRARTSPPKPKALPELTPTHPQWQACKNHLADGGTMPQLKKSFQITLENEKLICAK